ncbi:hypothetical protein B0H14DRAFT_322645 [Mycena olivaceomarginata]|nr:hypothetical protein B0H14DRAFT_322645 [Mycena olivaceomarginata]
MAATVTYSATGLQLTRFFLQKCSGHLRSERHAVAQFSRHGATPSTVSGLCYRRPWLPSARPRKISGWKMTTLTRTGPPERLNRVDEEWPPPDPLNAVDDVPATPSRKRRPSPTFDRVFASGPAQSGSHRRRAFKRARGVETHGHVARPAAIRKYVAPAQPFHLPVFDVAALPTAHGAYAAKVEDRAEKRGSKQRRSLAELIGLGF